MSEVLQTNIFFYITSIAVVVVTVFIIVALFYIVSILKNVRDVSDKVKRGSDVLGKDLSSVRKVVKKEGLRLKQIGNFFMSNVTTKRGTKNKK